MDSLPSFAYPEDTETAREWLAERRVSPSELDHCLRIQRAEAPPPRTLRRIASDFGIDRRLPAARAVERFQRESKRPLAAGRAIRESLDDQSDGADYVLVRMMGQGGQGEVFLAQQEKPRRLVVLKRLLPELSYDGRSILRFLREALLIERVDDPRVIRVFDYGVSADRFFIALEYVAGENLAEFLRRHGRLAIEPALRFIREAAAALAAVSAAGVVHADVKPANLVIPARGPALKLIDFGASVASGARQSDDGGWFGSPPFMAPEQFRAEPLTGAADIYSLGITLYTLLAGDVPFAGRTAVETGFKHVNEPMPSLLALFPGYPPRAASLIRRMTAKKPADRWPSCAELVPEIDRILSDVKEAGEAMRSPAPGAPKPAPPRRPARTVSCRAPSPGITRGSPPPPPEPADTGG